MPRVKIDYVVSLSNEDPENPASNLLAWDISKRKWLCRKGEPTCSVVLQLAQAVQIQSVHIGAHHTALVEVLVGLSEKPSDPFEVLVPSCVFVPASESRRGSGVDRVRTFSGDQLTASRLRPWDRLRVVCSQPYNKHCQYGLSFIHVFSPEGAVDPAPDRGQFFSLPLEPSDDEDSFHPGELFAQHRSKTGTEAQIRQASSNVLKNISDPSSSLSKVQINQNSQQDCKEAKPQRTKASLSVSHSHKKKENNTLKRKRELCDKEQENQSKKVNKVLVDRNVSYEGAEAHSTTDKAGSILRGVVFAISGYENPRRGLLRDTALGLGARYQPDFSPRCTHLICAFPNTPKLRAVRSSGQACVAVRGEWIEDCARFGCRRPWRPYATEPQPPDTADSGSDTEDEIERVLRDQSDDDDVTRLASPPTRRASRLSPDKLLSECLEGWSCGVCQALPPPRRALLRRYLRALGAADPDADAHAHAHAHAAPLVLCQGGHAPHSAALRLRPAWLWAALALGSAPDPLAYSF